MCPSRVFLASEISCRPPAFREICATPWTEVDQDAAASAIVNDDPVGSSDLREMDQRIRTFEAVRMLLALLQELGGHSFAAALHLLPNVKDEPRAGLARGVRQHDP